MIGWLSRMSVDIGGIHYIVVMMGVQVIDR